MSFAPTPEQQKAVDLFKTGADLVVEAGAGTGKTSTLVHLAKSDPERQMQYVAFNKAIVMESKTKMPSNVSCNTMHSLAMREEGKRYRHRLDSGRMKSMQIARELDIDDIQIVVGGVQKKRLSAGYLASHVMRAVQTFCQTADPEPTTMHFTYIDGIDMPTADGRKTYDNNRAIAKALLPALVRAWADMTDTEGRLPYGHHCYLKSWQLGAPRIYADVILFDEAQDSSPVMADIVAQQTRAQRVYVGDTQQQLYAWLGAVNALAEVDGAERTFLTKSFRFGPEVARTANLVLEWLDAELRITGNEALNSQVARISGDPDVILCRTNAKVLEIVLDKIKAGKRVAVVGGTKDLVDFAKAARDLQQKGWTSHRELACFDTWGEVEAYVANDPQGGELKLMVQLVTDYGPEVIIRNLDNATDERAADITVSTAHKSKGREWDRVKLADDFPEPDGDDPSALDDGELRLLYVAVTRAQVVLDPYDVPMFFDAKPGRSAR